MASSSSSHLHQTKYDVFISFRGTDTRSGFLSHLTKELRQQQIDVYVDERLESGDEISSALLKAIEGSLISLIIFSKDYASSKWCLEELEKIMECKELNNQIVIPVFYNINPSDVRHQIGTYKDAFSRHEQKLKNNMEKVEIWRSVLSKAANLSGFHYQANSGNESQLIDKIVKHVMKKLDDIYPAKSKQLVGFERNFAGVESLLEMDSKEVKIIGIWGMGGIGKTTLAHAVHDKFYSKFDTSCFMENVREESKKVNGLRNLLQKLYSQLLKQEDISVNDAKARGFIERRLYRKKVLIVLDDVDTSEQLECLGEQYSLGPGSRIIVTSRDKHVLISRGVHAIHEVMELNFEESLKLFSLNAFNQRYPKKGYEELSEGVVFYAEGIPLALKVLGSHLHSRNKEIWESALEKLQKYPNLHIQNVLKVSYDGLDEVEKNIFLDIAFFFKGHPKDDIIKVLDACGFYATSGIDYLLDKALINILEDNTIEMHDLLKEMGEQIVREESIKYPGRRSRLNDIEEIYDVLQNNLGTEAIEGIILDVSQIEIVHLSPDTFQKMPNLRILKIYSEPWGKGSNLNVPFDLKSFSKKLRYFHWDEYPLESLPINFFAEKLVELHMERSHIKKLWDGVKDLKNLKILNLRGSKQLMELPDFSMASSLEKVHLSDCENLCRVHPSILSLNKLVSFDLMRCKGLKSLRIIELCSLKSVKQLSLHSCKQVNKMELHILFDALLGLETLCLESCKYLSEIPDNITSLSSLKSLNLDKSGVESLPSSIKHLSRLQHISLNNCKKLKSLPELPPFIKHLHVQHCPSLETVFRFTTLLLQVNEDMDRLDISFKECVKLDEQSLSNVMLLTHLSLVQGICKSFSDVEACYPGSRVPEWFRYKVNADVSFTIELGSPSDPLLGFLPCCVLPQSASNEECQICFYYIFKDHVRHSNKVFYFGELNTDHVYLWYCPFEDMPFENEGGKCDDSMITCMFICAISNQFVPVIACGVCPIYASKFYNIFEQILQSDSRSNTKTNRHQDVDDQPPTEKLKEPCTIEPVHQGLELDLDTKSNNTSESDHDIDVKPDELQSHFHMIINSRNSVFNPLPLKLTSKMKGMGLKEIMFL